MSLNDTIEGLEESNAIEMKFVKNFKAGLNSIADGMMEECLNRKGVLKELKDKLQPEIPATVAAINSSEKAGVIGWMELYIRLCEDAIAEIKGEDDLEKERAEKEHSREIHAIETTLQKRAEQRSRVENMRETLERLCDPESSIREELWKFSKDELTCVRKEEEALENQIARCEERFLRRTSGAEKESMKRTKRMKRYKRVVQHVKKHAENEGIILGAV
ncbi:hypothetical protein EJ02DRAFT_465582 [Clathrospora elynae]|uniref:Uncharacterized protein n=1 Tax=Clathrospora elynae TaxID=706981 RepID=A0A6A5SSR0_9PLEO|nr:hypothetical protein EJ02DRAFT_465582 [Clathrospora elynae]